VRRAELQQVGLQVAAVQNLALLRLLHVLDPDQVVPNEVGAR
jgi:hypothetical protein